jgi:hypothetical protein
VAALQPFHDGWANYQGLLLAAIRELTPEQLALRTAPHLWAIWQLAGHMAGARPYWFHDVLGEGDPAIRDMFRVANTTVPDLPLEDAGWEDDEDHPRGATEIVEALGRTWTMIDDCLRRWRPDDLAVEFSRQRRTDTPDLHPTVGDLSPHGARPPPRRGDIAHPRNPRPSPPSTSDQAAPLLCRRCPPTFTSRSRAYGRRPRSQGGLPGVSGS